MDSWGLTQRYLKALRCWDCDIWGLVRERDSQKMKKKIPVLLAVLSLMLTACGDTSKVDSILAKDNSSAAEISQADSKHEEISLNETDSAVIAEAEKLVSQYTADITPSAPDTSELENLNLSNGDIDIDLTTLTPNLIYSQVFDMVNEPDKYIGKKVRVTGSFAYTHDTTTDGDYFAVFIADAAACCQQGMEFVLTGEHKYPDDYPAIGDSITVEGIFNTYTENDWQYCQLKDAALQTA